MSIATALKSKIRPALRYHGGKWNLARWIVEYFPEHKVYVEPFGGAASVLIQKKRSYAEVYNELDPEVVNLFAVLRSPMSLELKRQLQLTPFARAEYFAAYESTLEPVERARRTIIKAFMGFGSDALRNKSGFRANSHRSGTTPAQDWRNYAEVLDLLIERLRGIVIENRDAIECMKQHDRPDTLFYVDPPYVHSTRQSAKRYLFEMTDEQHIALADFLGRVQGKVVLSGYDSPLYNDLYKGWYRVEREALADGARKRTEVLWLNFKPQGQLL